MRVRGGGVGRDKRARGAWRATTHPPRLPSRPAPPVSLFYTDVKLFSDQTESDAVLEDAAAMLGCTRSSLHVIASDKGVVVGRVTFTDDGDVIDCTKMGVGGKAIPPSADRIGGISSDAAFILLVEKEAAFMRIAEDRCGGGSARAYRARHA